ncbi:MAG: hypothetical protein K5683_10505 [Prevotella sp.]|nr:hypothetical protein [Prevotella sp.]
MKTRFFYLLMAVSLMTFTACSDDDDDVSTDPDSEEQQGSSETASSETSSDEYSEADKNETSAPEGNYSDNEMLLLNQQQAIVSIITTLTDEETVDPHFDQHKYEPTYGQVLDDSNPLVRAVRCDSVSGAEQLFRELVGCDELITTTSDGLAVSLKNMPLLADSASLTLGTLTFHRGDGARETGYVDVNIPCIPRLARIDYLTTAAFPMNDGANSPYKVGDLVWIDENSKYCSGYYVCVQQADVAAGLLVHLCEGEAKGNETINLDDDNDGCWYPYNESKGETTTSDCVRTYVNFLLTEKEKVADLKLFLDGKAQKKKPAHSNRKRHVFPGGFATDDNYAFKSSDGRNARVFYGAYFGSYEWVPPYHNRIAQYVYVPNYCESLDYVTPYTMTYVKDSWWNNHVDEKHNYTMNVIRFYKKVDNATLEYSPSKDNLEFENDAQFVTQQNLGWVYGENNRLYRTRANAWAAGTRALGFIAYVNDGSDNGNKATEAESGYGHGLVVSYTMANTNSKGTYTSVRWDNFGQHMVDIEEGTEFTQFVNRNTGAKAALNDFDGLAKTFMLRMAKSPAALKLNDWNTTRSPLRSEWFLPSSGQWAAIMCSPGAGGVPKPSENGGFPTYLENGTHVAYDNINRIIKQTLSYGSYVWFYRNQKYWSSSAYSEKVGVYLRGDGEQGTHLSYWTNTYGFVRPVFAF